VGTRPCRSRCAVSRRSDIAEFRGECHPSRVFREVLGQLGFMLARIGAAGGGVTAIASHGLNHWKVTLAFAGMAVLGSAIRLISDPFH
jgi:hypothetical protein